MGTTLEILAPFLPYGIEVEVCRSKRGTLVALAMGQISMRVMADVIVPANGPEADLYSLSDTVPVLRSFADLCTPLEDGTVPAHQAAMLLANDWAARYSYATHEVRGNRVTVRLMQWDAENGETLVGDISILADWNFHLDDEGEILHFENMLEAYDYLRSKHFALPVNGKPLVEGADYIRKEASHAR